MIEADDLESAVKIVVIGNGNVGKTSLIRRFCKDGYETVYNKTIGIEYSEKTKKLSGSDEVVKYMIWDCAGQEDFDSVTREYWEEADAVVLAFSTTDRNSFDMISQWKAKLEQVITTNQVVMVLLQNKIDLFEEAAVEPGEAEDLARKLKTRFYRVSVRDNSQVDDVFEYLASAVLKKSRVNIETPAAPAVRKSSAIDVFHQEQKDNGKALNFNREASLGRPKKKESCMIS